MQRATSLIRRRSAPRRIAANGLLSMPQLASGAGEIVHAVRCYARIWLIEPAAIGANGYRSFDRAPWHACAPSGAPSDLGSLRMKFRDSVMTPSAAGRPAHSYGRSRNDGCPGSKYNWPTYRASMNAWPEPPNCGVDALTPRRTATGSAT
jgi:hypothetical protein